ncbi:MAG: hypothetical protein MK213_06445 [Planctomycetes bacterium]|nr:hypothetical protein [Planctomycetota bacterium]
MQEESYDHRQTTWWIPAIGGAFASLGLLLSTLSILSFFPWSLIVAAITLVALFHGLRVTVDSKDIQLRFGIGIIGKRIPLESIAAARMVRNKWWYGFGIRLTPHGWLWNQHGLDAIELCYQNDKTFRIGTDDAPALFAYLMERINPSLSVQRDRGPL